MPTQIDSAGITFNDATSLTSAAIGTSQLVNGSVIASKLGTNEQKQIAKAWVNFNGATGGPNVSSIPSTHTFSCVAGGNILTWTAPSGYFTNNVGDAVALVITGSSTFGGASVSELTTTNGGVLLSTLTLSLPAGKTFTSTITNQSASTTSTVKLNSVIRSSYNVSSVTKNGTGDYTVNFATPMADANYAMTFGGHGNSATSGFGYVSGFPSLPGGYTPTINSMKVRGCNGANTIVDLDCIALTIFGN